MKPHYPTPDAAAAAYFALVEVEGYIPPQRLSETVAVCSACGGPESTRISNDRTEWYSICADCGAAWRPDEREVGLLRGHVKIRGRVGWEQAGGRLVRAAVPGRADLAELAVLVRVDRLAALPYLRHLVERRPRDYSADEWGLRLAVWRSFLCVNATVRESRLEAKRRPLYTRTAERTGAALTAEQVERAIEQARAVVERRLARRENVAA